MHVDAGLNLMAQLNSQHQSICQEAGLELRLMHDNAQMRNNSAAAANKLLLMIMRVIKGSISTK